MEIHGIHGTQPVNAPQPVESAPASEATDQVQAADQLEISQEAEMASQAADLVEHAKQLPEIRAEQVADIKAAIESGSYETEEKINIAVERLLDEIG
jgi:negative regulator of flagellin synthesis FlgM